MNPAHALLDELHAHHIHIEQHGGRLKLRAPQRPPDDLLHRLRRHKADLLALLPDTKPTQRVITSSSIFAFRIIPPTLGRP